MRGAVKVPLGDGIFAQHPIHFMVHDKHGKTAIIEFIEGRMIINKNTVNVMTNSPQYSLQLENLKKYDKFQIGMKIDSKKPNYTNGAELTGLPGDYSSTSRFVRASILVRLTPPSVSLVESLSRSKVILDSVSVPRGTSVDITMVKILRDHVNQKYYFQRVGDFYDYMNNEKVYTHDLTGGMNMIDLKSID